MNTVIVWWWITWLLAAIASRPYTDSLTILDKHPDWPPCDDGRLLLCPDTCAHLSDLGIISVINNIMIPLTKRTCTVSGMNYPDQPAGRWDYHYPVIVEEKKLWHALYKRLDTIPIERSTPSSLTIRDNTVTLTCIPHQDETTDTSWPETIPQSGQYDLLLACDGSTSWVREQLFWKQTKYDCVTMWSSQSLITVNRNTTNPRTQGEARVIIGDKTVDEYRCISESQLIHNHYSYDKKTLATDHYWRLVRQWVTYERIELRTKQSWSHFVTNPVQGPIVLCGSAVMDLPLLGWSNANVWQLIPRIPRRYAFARSSSHPLRQTLGIELAHSIKAIHTNYTHIIETMMQSALHDRWTKIVYIWTKKTPWRIARLYSTMDTFHPEVGSYDTRYPLLIEALISSPRIRIHGWHFFHWPNPGTLAPAWYLVLRANEPKVWWYELLKNHKPVIMIFQGLTWSKNDAQSFHKRLADRVGDAAALYRITNTYQLHDDDDNSCLGDPDGQFHRACAAQWPCVYVIYPDGTIGRRSLGYRFHNFEEWWHHYRETPI